MTISAWVFSYRLMADVDAEMDDPSIRDGSPLEILEMMASPQLSHVSLHLDSNVASKVLDECLAEFKGDYDESSPPPPVRWLCRGTVKPQVGREYTSWLLVDEAPQDLNLEQPYAMVIAQKMELGV